MDTHGSHMENRGGWAEAGIRGGAHWNVRNGMRDGVERGLRPSLRCLPPQPLLTEKQP